MPSCFQSTPLAPCATSANPTVAPTMLCVPDTGILNAVAIISHAHDPNENKLIDWQ